MHGYHVAGSFKKPLECPCWSGPQQPAEGPVCTFRAAVAVCFAEPGHMFAVAAAAMLSGAPNSLRLHDSSASCQKGGPPGTVPQKALYADHVPVMMLTICGGAFMTLPSALHCLRHGPALQADHSD